MSGPGSELGAGVESARLTEALRELRGRTGLSLVALAERTAYSKSSWERYLNGKKLPPRDAVEALCRLAGEPPGRLVALWELADAAWSGRAAPPVAAVGPAAAERADDAPGRGGRTVAGARTGHPPWRLPRRLVPVAAGSCAGVLAVVAVLTFRTADGEAGGGPAGSAAPTSFEVTGCRGMACDGKDPHSMFCGGQGLVETVVERTAVQGRHVEIRYAEACGAAWGRLRGGRIGDRIEVSAPGVRARSARVQDRFDAEGYLVTPMAAARAPQGIRLCLQPAGGAEECFPR